MLSDHEFEEDQPFGAFCLIVKHDANIKPVLGTSSSF